ISDLSPAYRDLIHNQKPTIKNKELWFIARNDAEARALKKKLEKGFQTYCGQIGAPHYTIHIEVKTEEADVEKFREQKAHEDKELVKKTVQEKEKRDQTGKANNKAKPLALGYKIQDESQAMELIQEEERRVTVEGYIFSVDIRKLRSGRSLLIIKATDYTDSLEIKMFSKGDDDAEKFKNV